MCTMTKRTYTAEFKTKVVLELLTGERELTMLAQENGIAPNQLRNWKNEFISGATRVFDKKSDEKLKEELRESSKREDNLSRKVGQLTMEVDFLKKTLKMP